MKVRKRFLKSLAIFMAVSMLVSLGSISGATTDEPEIEIIIPDEVDCEKMQLIINTIKGNSSGTIGISPASLLCIFGHSTTTTTVFAVTHRHWATAPRCREQIYRITYCTRSGCNYSVGTITSDGRIPCCA